MLISPALGKQTLKDSTTFVVLYSDYKLIRLDNIVFIDARTHLKAAEFTSIASSNAATTNAPNGHSIDLLTIFHIIIVHIHASTFTRDFPIIGGISAEEEKNNSYTFALLI